MAEELTEEVTEELEIETSEKTTETVQEAISEESQESMSASVQEAVPAADGIKIKIATALTTILLVVSVCICVMTISQVGSKGYVSIAGRSLFRVVTGSMEPEIAEGALLISKKTNIEKIRVGDIICFRSKDPSILGQVITHRVIGIGADPSGNILLTTKGDANLVQDGYYVTKDNLIGRVAGYTGEESVMADVVTFMTGKIGFLACIVFPVLLIGTLILRECVSNIQRELDTVVRELELQQAEENSWEMSPEEYKAMYDRLRSEILEELKQGVEEEKEQ